MRAMTVAAAERRKASRYRLRLPVLFSWTQGNKSHTLGGFTRDVSVTGVFVTSRTVPPPQATVNLELLLPALDQMPENAIRATGSVVRTFVSSQPQGFAIATDLCAGPTGTRFVQHLEAGR